MELWEIIIAIIIVIFGSGSIVGIIIQNRIQKLQSIEEKLREERRKVYTELLRPFIELFSKPNKPEKVMAHILSLEYRQTSFDLNLVGSDEVVRAYGNLMQHIYHNNSNDGKNSSEMIRLWAVLLLEIRKSLGNKSTKLNEKDMLRHLITDIEKVDFKLSE